jgi:hypothetical protein
LAQRTPLQVERQLSVDRDRLPFRRSFPLARRSKILALNTSDQRDPAANCRHRAIVSQELVKKTSDDGLQLVFSPGQLNGYQNEEIDWTWTPIRRGL